LSSSIPLKVKFHNLLNQALLAKHSPELLLFPTAAIISNANAPVFIQEISRGLRKILSNLSWRIYYVTHGLIKPSFVGWDNFEFLRDGKMLKVLLENIRNDFVDKKAIEKFLDKLIKYKKYDFLHNVSNQILKIYTTELMLR
jgi:hypothetical protein